MISHFFTRPFLYKNPHFPFAMYAAGRTVSKNSRRTNTAAVFAIAI